MWKRTEDEPGFLATTAKPKAASLEPSLIGRSLVMRGELRGGEDLLIEGRLEGTILLESHTVTIGEHGSVMGDVYAREIHVRGELQGDLHGSEQVIVHETGQVRGNITAPRVCLENGAKLKGTIDMDPQPQQAQSGMISSAIKQSEEVKGQVEKLSRKAADKSELDAVQ